MPKVKQFLDVSVVEATRQRMAQLYDLFDNVVVMFSGGKDSLVCLKFALEAARNADTLPLRVAFRDEEILPDSVIDFVESWRHHPDVDLRWYTPIMQQTRFVLGDHRAWLLWDPDRSWARLKPSWAIDMPLGPDGHVTMRQFDQYVTHDGMKGSTAMIMGLRASESLARYRSCVEKLNMNWIVNPRYGFRAGKPSAGYKSCKPIFDWEESDIFKWLEETNTPYCELYHREFLAGHPLRVAGAIHTEAAKRLKYWAKMDPALLERILLVFPDMVSMLRYQDEIDYDADIHRHGACFEDVLGYIRTLTPPSRQKEAMGVYKMWVGMSIRSPEAYTPKDLMRYLSKGGDGASHGAHLPVSSGRKKKKKGRRRK